MIHTRRTSYRRLAAITAFVVAGGLFVSAPATATASSSEGESALDYDEFVSQAQAVGGLTEFEAERAWEDPNVRATVPVYASLEPVAETTVSLGLQPDPHTGELLATQRTTVTYRAMRYSQFCAGLASVDIEKTWDYNGTSVTAVSSSRDQWTGIGKYFQRWTLYSERYIEGLGNPHAYHRTRVAAEFSQINGTEFTVRGTVTARRDGSHTANTYPHPGECG